MKNQNLVFHEFKGGVGDVKLKPRKNSKIFNKTLLKHINLNPIRAGGVGHI